MNEPNPSKEKIELIRDEFFKKFENKYTLLGNKSLGEGYFACVFKAHDIDRNIDVAIKVFFNGIAPKGSERGWHITSSYMHNQIAPTSTIESFYSNVVNGDCKAVVQRYVPGKSLKKILYDFDDIEASDNYQNVLNDFGLTYLRSLLQVLNFCHNQGFGHGDLHDGNIMVFLEDHPTKHSLRVVLIDFDNSSIKETLNLKTEKDKIESDIGLFKYSFDKAFYQWKYFEALKELFLNYDSITEFQFSYSIVSLFIENCTNAKKSKADVANVLGKFPHLFMGFHIPPTLRCLQVIAEIENLTAIFGEELKTYKEQISQIQNWSTNVEVEYLSEGTTSIYQKIFSE